MNAVEKRKFFPIPVLELRPLYRPDHSQSLYQLSYPGYLYPYTHTHIQYMCIYIYTHTHTHTHTIYVYIYIYVYRYKKFVCARFISVITQF
jgi:hypothetical protein